MRLQKTLNAFIILCAVGMLFVAAFVASSALKVQDMAEYWSAAHLVRQNPYSESLVTSFERSFGYSMNQPAMVIRNPPSALFFILPFRYMSYNIAFAVWTLVSVFMIAGCARASARFSNARENTMAPAFLCLLFGPTAALLMLGQIVVLDLLGVTLFLIMAERRRDWLAGACLSLACVKPHILLLFLIVVAFWSIKSKRWGIIASLTASLVATTLVAVLLNPHILSQYVVFAREFSGETTPYPNLGGLLYLISGSRLLAFVPQVAGLLWVLFFWRRHASDWNWKTHGMLVLLVSVASCYYSFPFDQVVLLPALIAAFEHGRRRLFLAGFILTNAGFAIYISNLTARFGFGYMFLWWTSLAWLATYLLAFRFGVHESAATSSPVYGA